MANAAKHRKKAAEFEQLKQFDRAIASYIRAIEESESEGEDVDVVLLNKVGDLTLRQGRVSDAVTYYERAVEHYAASGLFNNAIALCNKILRSAPGRSNIYFTLGRICARKGLRGDATRNFLEYATRMQQDERIDEGMRALSEVADLMPELTEIRRLVEEHAVRAGIELPRRKTPAFIPAAENERAVVRRADKSKELVFLDTGLTGAGVSDAAPLAPVARTAAHATKSKTPRGGDARPGADGRSAKSPRANATQVGPASLDAFLLFDPSRPGAVTPPGATKAVAPSTSPSTSPSAGDSVDLPQTEHAALVERDELELLARVERIEGLETDEEFVADAGSLAVNNESLDGEGSNVELTWIVPRDEIETMPVADFEPSNDVRDIEDTSTDRLADLVVEEFDAVADSPGALVVSGSRAGTPVFGASIPRSLTPIDVSPIPDLEKAIEVGAHLVAQSEAMGALAERRPPYRLDPHDFILPGELPPLVVDDDLMDAGLGGSHVTAELSHDIKTAPTPGEDDLIDSEAPMVTPPYSAEIGDPEEEAAEAVAISDVAEDALRDAVEALSALRSTPSLPLAAVAAEAGVVAISRREELRAAVARTPHDWMLRRRLAEALFEVGEREGGLAELQTALSGLAQSGDLSTAIEIADELVTISPERIQYHQKRVELAVRLSDHPRLRVAYLDLADTLVRTGDDARAHVVYARVLELDPWDERARSALGSAAPPPPPPPSAAAPADDFVNLADWLREDEPGTTRMRMREPVVSGDEQADFDALLRHFKEGVSRSLGEDDYESHYDLGVAYKEMGLHDDAIAEFQKALRSRHHRLAAYEALGQCLVEQSRHTVAVTVLTRALHEPGLGDEQRVGVLYLLAYSCEALQRWDEARSYYSRAYATDIHFRDVAARLAALDLVTR